MNQNSNRRRANWRRRGFTMLEIMTSVTLALMLMYAVARIFSRVGGEMNNTMSTMEMTNTLRFAKNRLTEDLEALTLVPNPPASSRLSQGYFCYTEGLGGPISRVLTEGPFSTSDLAIDSERYQKDPSDITYYADSTVGDNDDILSFTAKAPVGKPFRGRYVRPVYRETIDGAGNVRSEIVGGEPDVFESETAEIIWFARGTTLYRRVLPVMSNNDLKDSLMAIQRSIEYNSHKGADDPTYDSNAFAGEDYLQIWRGFGFYRYYDVSVHQDYSTLSAKFGYDPSTNRYNEMATQTTNAPRVVANTLGDLSNRRNRYFYWNSFGLVAPGRPSHLDISGGNGAWYWLRMPTLQESAAWDFRVGAPFGQSSLSLDGATLYPNVAYENSRGYNQRLSLVNEDAEFPLLPNGEFSAIDLPIKGKPFIDFWNNPVVWNGKDPVNGDDIIDSDCGELEAAHKTMAQDLGNTTQAASDRDQPAFMTSDVILTNVISFNVKAWDPSLNAYVDLGSVDPASSDPSSLRFGGYYAAGNVANSIYNYAGAGASLAQQLWTTTPCVYDTWTEQYQTELFRFIDDFNRNNNENAPYPNGGAPADIPSNAAVPASALPCYPPPYSVPLKSLQIEIRVFDPRSKSIKQSTFNVDLPQD